MRPWKFLRVTGNPTLQPFVQPYQASLSACMRGINGAEAAMPTPHSAASVVEETHSILEKGSSSTCQMLASVEPWRHECMRSHYTLLGAAQATRCSDSTHRTIRCYSQTHDQHSVHSSSIL